MKADCGEAARNSTYRTFASLEKFDFAGQSDGSFATRSDRIGQLINYVRDLASLVICNESYSAATRCSCMESFLKCPESSWAANAKV